MDSSNISISTIDVVLTPAAGVNGGFATRLLDRAGCQAIRDSSESFYLTIRCALAYSYPLCHVKSVIFSISLVVCAAAVVVSLAHFCTVAFANAQ